MIDYHGLLFLDVLQSSGMNEIWYIEKVYG